MYYIVQDILINDDEKFINLFGGKKLNKNTKSIWYNLWCFSLSWFCFSCSEILFIIKLIIFHLEIKFIIWKRKKKKSKNIMQTTTAIYYIHTILENKFFLLLLDKNNHNNNNITNNLFNQQRPQLWKNYQNNIMQLFVVSGIFFASFRTLLSDWFLNY